MSVQSAVPKAAQLRPLPCFIKTLGSRCPYPSQSGVVFHQKLICSSYRSIGIALRLKAIFGDLAIALAAFCCAAFLGYGRKWFVGKTTLALLAFFAIGPLATIGLKYLNTEMMGGWTYDGVMPLLPVLGTGISPIMKSVFVPEFVVLYMRRPMSENGDE
jgi:hypothetical protein